MTISRILDANINRAREALRVLEDISRFLLEDSSLTSSLRNMRSQVTSLLSREGLSAKDLYQARESEEDIGKEFPQKSYTSLKEVINANFSRLQESLRVMEELYRMKNMEVFPEWRRLRFNAYTLQKEMFLRVEKKEWLKKLDLYVITDEEISKKRHEEVAKEAIEGGARFIQLRDKKSSTRRILEAGWRIREITRQAGAVLIINDRVDIALALDAEGVHLGEEDLPVQEARKIMGIGKIIGASSHSIEEALKKQEEGADYVSLGPIFSTSTKKNLPPPLGVEIIREAKKKLRIPLVAIGGIREENIEEILEAGSDGVAMISELLKGESIRDKVKKLREKITEYREKRKLP